MMKKCFTKKIASIFLSIVMVASCLSIGIVPAYASTYTIAQLETLIDSYEAKMNGTIYSNMVAGYEAWYDAYKVYIGIKAGIITDSEIDTAYETLSSAIDSMTAWSSYTGTAVPSFANDDSTISTNNYSNILYTTASSEDYYNHGTSTSSSPKMNVRVYHPATVLLYDGANESKMPVMFSARRGGSNRSVYVMMPTTSQFSLPENWHGEDTRTNYTWLIGQSASRVGISVATASSSTNLNNSDTYKFFANTLVYSSDFANGTYSSQFNIGWTYYAGSSTTVNTSDIVQSMTNTTNPVYVVNYKSLLDSIKATSLSSITSYSYNTAKSLLESINTAQNINPNSYFTSVSNISDSVSNCANAISSAVSSINSANNNLSSVNYDTCLNLANYYGARTALYNENNSSSYYTDESFANFKTAYETVTTAFNDIYSESSYFTDATSLYEDLVSAYTSLEQAAQYINDSELQMLFDTYHDLKVSYYDETSWQTLSSTVSNILTYYNNEDRTLGITLIETDYNQSLYDGLVDEFTSSLAGLRLNYELCVNANGNFESITDVIEKAEALDAKNYSNGIILTEALINAKNYKTQMAQETFTDQNTQYDNYVNAVKALDSVLSSLQLSFANILDGEVISKTISTTSTTQAGSGKIYFSMKDATTSTVLFKTTASQQTYTVPYNIKVDNNWSYSFIGTWYAGARISGLGYGSATAPVDTETVTATNDESCTVNLNWYDNTENDSTACALTLADGSSLTYHETLMQGSNTGTFLDAVQNTSDQMIYGNVNFTVPARSQSSTSSRTYTVTSPTLYAYTYVNDSHGGEYTATDTNDVINLTVIDVSDLFSLIDSCENLVTDTLGNTLGTYTSSSWKNFEKAFTSSKASLDYKTMDTNGITEELDNRYNNLVATFNSLRLTPNYLNLDSVFSSKTTARDSASLVRVNGTTNPVASNYLSYKNGKLKNYFDINLSMLDTIVSAETGSSLSSTFSNGTNYYTVNSLAYFDKILNGIYEDSAVPTNSSNYDNTYVVSSSKSNVRFNQNQYADGKSITYGDSTLFTDSTTITPVQERINSKTTTLTSLEAPSTAESISCYESFDGFISDIKNTDFSVYDSTKANAFKQKAYEYLTNGVYVVDQQLFAQGADDEASELDKIAYDGSMNYYSGLGSVDSKSIDACTTELLTMYNGLLVDNEDSSVSYVKKYTVTTNIYIDGIQDSTTTQSCPVGSNVTISPNNIDGNTSSCNLLNYEGTYANASGTFSPKNNGDGTFVVKTIGDNIILNFYYQTNSESSDITVSIYDRIGKLITTKNMASRSTINVNNNTISTDDYSYSATLYTGGFTFSGWACKGALLENGTTTLTSDSIIQARYTSNGGVLYNVNVTDSSGSPIQFNSSLNGTDFSYTGLTALEFNRTISFSSSSNDFFAWAIQTSNNMYSILTYNKDYNGKVYGNMNIVEICTQSSQLLNSNYFNSSDTQKIMSNTPFIFIRSEFETNCSGSSLDLSSGETYDSTTGKTTYFCRYTPLANSSNCTIIKTGMINMTPQNYSSLGVSSDETVFQLDSTDEYGNILTDTGQIVVFSVSNATDAGQFSITTANLNYYRRAFLTYQTTINDKTVYITVYSNIINPTTPT